MSSLMAPICSPWASASALTSATASLMVTLTAALGAETLCAGVPSARHASSSAVAVTETVEPTASPPTVTEPAERISATALPSTRTVTWSKSAGTSPESDPAHSTCRLPSPLHARTPVGTGGGVTSPTCVAMACPEGAPSPEPACGPIIVRVPSALSRLIEPDGAVCGAVAASYAATATRARRSALVWSPMSLPCFILPPLVPRVLHHVEGCRRVRSLVPAQLHQAEMVGAVRKRWEAPELQVCGIPRP